MGSLQWRATPPFSRRPPLLHTCTHPRYRYGAQCALAIFPLNRGCCILEHATKKNNQTHTLPLSPLPLSPSLLPSHYSKTTSLDLDIAHSSTHPHHLPRPWAHGRGAIASAVEGYGQARAAHHPRLRQHSGERVGPNVQAGHEHGVPCPRHGVALVRHYGGPQGSVEGLGPGGSARTDTHTSNTDSSAAAAATS